jgi:hypothetical protein
LGFLVSLNIVGFIRFTHPIVKKDFEPIFMITTTGRDVRDVLLLKLIRIKRIFNKSIKKNTIIFPNKPFEYFFLDDINEQYKSDEYSVPFSQYFLCWLFL